MFYGFGTGFYSCAFCVPSDGIFPHIRKGLRDRVVGMEEREIDIQSESNALLLKALEDIGEAKMMAKQALEDAKESLKLREESHLVFEGIRSTIKTFLAIISLCTFTLGIIRAIPILASWLG